MDFSIATTGDDCSLLDSDISHTSQINFFDFASVIQRPNVDAISSCDDQYIITNIEIVTLIIVLKSVE